MHLVEARFGHCSSTSVLILVMRNGEMGPRILWTLRLRPDALTAHFPCRGIRATGSLEVAHPPVVATASADLVANYYCGEPKLSSLSDHVALYDTTKNLVIARLLTGQQSPCGFTSKGCVVLCDGNEVDSLESPYTSKPKRVFSLDRAR